MLDLKNRTIILASASPRRKKLLSLMDIPFLCVIGDNEEVIPEGVTPYDAVMAISKQKSDAIVKDIDVNDIVITADTVVFLKGQILGKPKDKDEEKAMLVTLSDSYHEVITGVTIADKKSYDTFYSVTKVWIRKIENDEIDYYVTKYNPIDKAGAYGIQEWIGAVGIERIEGSYYNVMGLPTEKVYSHLKQFIDKDRNE